MAEFLIRCTQCQVTAEAVQEPSDPLAHGGPECILPPKGWIGTLIFPGTRFAVDTQSGAFCSLGCVRAWANEQGRLALQRDVAGA